MPEPATLTLLGTGFLAMTVQYIRRKYHRAKPWFDRILASTFLVAFAPIIVVCAALVKLTSRGPAFYRQERVGHNGKTFHILKLRTMYRDAERRTGPVWAKGDFDDPRVTPLGRILRRMHLDELPQIINVLKGEMSIVGPRPERPYFVEKLRGQVPEYDKRLTVKPGITGLAQIHAGYDCTLRDVRRKAKLDAMYIHRMCWWFDFVIMAKTLRKFLGSA